MDNGIGVNFLARVFYRLTPQFPDSSLQFQEQHLHLQTHLLQHHFGNQHHSVTGQPSWVVIQGLSS